MDEPFSGFDPLNQERISDVIRELRDGGMTILLSAHQMQLVENIADRVLMINHGKEMISGTLNEIRKSTISGQKLMITYHGEVNEELLQQSDDVRSSTLTADGEWEIYLSENDSLNEALQVLLKAGSVASLRTTEVNLHEIFIESFKEGGTAHE